MTPLRVNKKHIILLFLFISIILSLSCDSKIEKHIKKGKHYLSHQSYEDAAAEFMMVVKENPSHAEANYLLGLSYAKMGEFKLCDKYFSKAHILSNKFKQHIVSHYYQLGLERKSKGDTDSAIKAFAKVLELDPSFDLGKNFFYIGDYYYENGNYNDCINAYQKAMLQFPEHPETQKAHFRVAKSYYELENYQAALHESRTFIQTYGSLDRITQKEISWIRGQSAYSLAERKLENEEFEEVIKYANTVIRTELPKVLLDNAYFLRGEANFNMGEYDDAKQDFNKVIQLNPNRSGRIVEKAEERLQQIYMGE